MKEDKNTEFKEYYSQQTAIVICSFLNTDGGKLYIGYNNNGEPVGVDNPEEIITSIDTVIKNHFLQWRDKISIVKEIEKGDKSVVVVSVEKIAKGIYAFLTDKSGSRKYYFRIGDKSVLSDEEHASYWGKISRYDFPIIKNYEPSRSSVKQEFVKTRDENRNEYKLIGELPRGNYLYKYMDLESALRSLEKKKGKEKKNPNIRFVEPTSWEDQYEGKFYTACYKSDDGKGNLVDIDSKVTPFLYACCFSSKRENEAAWVLYSHNRKGLASRCVEFTLNRRKFRDELVKHQKNSVFYIGAVQYMNKERIDRIHEPKIGKDNHRNEDYFMYFEPFTMECYLNLLLLKRPAFEHEKEVRIFIVPNDEIENNKTKRDKNGNFPVGVKPRSLYVDIDWSEVIEEVRIDENCTDYEVSLLQNSLDELVNMKLKKAKKMSSDELMKIKSKYQLKKFNPYKDEKLKDGPITIVTNQKG